MLLPPLCLTAETPAKCSGDYQSPQILRKWRLITAATMGTARAIGNRPYNILAAATDFHSSFLTPHSSFADPASGHSSSLPLKYPLPLAAIYVKI